MVCAPVRSFSVGIIDRTGAQTMLYLTCTTISSVDLAHYGVRRLSLKCNKYMYLLEIVIFCFC